MYRPMGSQTSSGDAVLVRDARLRYWYVREYPPFPLHRSAAGIGIHHFIPDTLELRPPHPVADGHAVAEVDIVAEICCGSEAVALLNANRIEARGVPGVCTYDITGADFVQRPLGAELDDVALAEVPRLIDFQVRAANT